MDIGCGTGRWLEKLRAANPKSMLGVDSSAEMLDRARAKLGARATLIEGDCSSVQFRPESADLILCSFLVGYVEDAPALLHRLAAALRPGGSIFVSEIHPGTARTLDWRRNFRANGELHELRTNSHSIASLSAAAGGSGLRVVLRIEPEFGEREARIFELAGKLDAFHAAANLPAIYILQFHKESDCSRAATMAETRSVATAVRGARVAVGPTRSICADLEIGDGRIDRIEPPLVPPFRVRPQTEAEVDLSGYLALPGLVNAHDHLEFALFPRLGRGGYQNSREWALDIQAAGAEVIATHRKVPRDVRMRWGGIRNLACGVTTVCHHNPYEPEIFNDRFPVRVLRGFDWAHSFAFTPDVVERKRNAQPGRAFILHLAEGLDSSSAAEIETLQIEGGLDGDTIVVHGLALDARGRELLRNARAGLVWCPTSNEFLFGRTLQKEDIAEFGAVALGSDSPLTAEGDLLDEIRYAHSVLGVDADILYNQVTQSPAEMLRLKNGEGAIRPQSFADLIAVRDTGLSPAESLVKLSFRDIEMVMVAGEVRLASDEMIRKLSLALADGLQPVTIDGLLRWIRAPLSRLWPETSAQLSGEIRLGGKRVFCE